MNMRRLFLLTALSFAAIDAAYAQTAPSGASAATPTGTVGTPSTGAGGAVPQIDAATGGGVATSANQTNGNQKTVLNSGTAQIGHTALPLGAGTLFSGAATITTAGTLQTLAGAGTVVNGCVVVDPSSNASGSTLTVDWTGKTGTSVDQFVTVLSPGQSTQCLFVPTGTTTLTITGSAAGLAIGGGTF